MAPPSRLPLVDIEAIHGPVGEALRAYPRRLNIISMMAHAETCVLAQLGVGRAVMNDQALPALERELLILLAARIDSGQYVWTQHRVIAEAEGATSGMIQAIESLTLAVDAFDASQTALLTYGAQVVRSGQVDDDVFEEASKYFANRELVEVIITIGYYMTMNRLTEATRTPLEATTGEAAAAGPGAAR